jgi:hypothetical protein
MKFIFNGLKQEKMKNFIEKDDELKGMMRKKGLLKPSEDFTAGVIHCLEENKSTVIIYTPLLSRAAWIMIASVVFAIALGCWIILGNSPSGEQDFSTGLYEQAAGYLKTIDLSVHLDSNALLIITLAILSIGTLLSIDFWIENKSNNPA